MGVSLSDVWYDEMSNDEARERYLDHVEAITQRLEANRVQPLVDPQLLRRLQRQRDALERRSTA